MKATLTTKTPLLFGILLLVIGIFGSWCGNGTEGEESDIGKSVLSYENNFGLVIFHHKRHVKRLKNKCSDCHPQPFGETFNDSISIETKAHDFCAGKCHQKHNLNASMENCGGCHKTRG